VSSRGKAKARDAKRRERKKRERATRKVDSGGRARRTVTFTYEDLAPLQKSPPLELVRNQGDLAGGFILSLATVYNDVKALAAFEQPMLPIRPKPTDFSAEAGEWRGHATVIHRFMAGVIYELMELINKKRFMLEEPDIKAAIGELKGDVLDDWTAIVDVALGRDAPSNAFRVVLAQIRNNASFHYRALEEMNKSYLAHFATEPKTPANEAACYSLGENMERTRFHFADAAVQGIMHRFAERAFGKAEGNDDRIDTKLVKFAGRVNVGLRFIIEAFIRLRQKAASLSTAPPPPSTPAAL
jgi:hypothetical protein